MNLFVWAQASSTAIPFGTLIGLLALWLLIQVPLVYVGSWVGYVRAAPWEHPTKTNSIPRQIPLQPWYLRSVHGTLLTGLLPFAVLFIELLFLFKNLWQDKSGYYYVFGFLSSVCTILIVTVSEVTIIATYNQLCAEVSLSTSRLIHRANDNRTTTGGGRVSLLAAAVLSGCLHTASGTTCSNCISLDLCRVFFSSATVYWHALYMVF